jgi:hypothetical protein
MLFQPILVHGILARPAVYGIWRYPLFPWTQGILILYFCMLAWKWMGRGKNQGSDRMISFSSAGFSSRRERASFHGTAVR